MMQYLLILLFLLLLLIPSLISGLGIYSKQEEFKGREFEVEDDAIVALPMEPPRRKDLKAASLDELRPPMCLDETLDLQYGDHYRLVHVKSRTMKTRCKYQDFQFSKRRLGAGGYGVVSKAVHKPTGQTFAVKSVIEMNPVWHKWIRAEECIQYGLDFPFITRLHCAMLHDWFAWLVLDLVEGETLERLLQRKKLSRPEIQKIAAQLIVTVEYLHLNGVVFGDLTAANLMIERDSGDIKLIDFGFAKRIKRNSTISAPVWSGEGQVLPDFGENYFNDWYGFGVILFQMLVSSRDDIMSDSSGEFRNKEFMDSAKLVKANCSQLIPNDPVTCGLVDSFLDYRAAQREWTDILGLRKDSAQSLRHHKFFEGFDWPALDSRVAPKSFPNQYNQQL